MTASGNEFIFEITKLNRGICKRLTNYIVTRLATYGEVDNYSHEGVGVSGDYNGSIHLSQVTFYVPQVSTTQSRYVCIGIQLGWCLLFYHPNSSM